jgi:hypothetical protein
MTLSRGMRIGPYEVVSAIGAGGMGEVFRARDTSLHRDVAVKILPAAFASDPDRLVRFTREAHTLAALNHPAIAQIHGLEERDGIRALVMEFVDGEDLAQRLARGPIPTDEALPIAADRRRARSGARAGHRAPRSEAGDGSDREARRRRRVAGGRGSARRGRPGGRAQVARGADRTVPPLRSATRARAHGRVCRLARRIAAGVRRGRSSARARVRCPRRARSHGRAARHVNCVLVARRSDDRLQRGRDDPNGARRRRPRVRRRPDSGVRSGARWRLAGSTIATARTIQSGSSRVGTFLAASPSRVLSTFAISSIDIAVPFSATATNRSPFAAGLVIARRCRSATSHPTPRARRSASDHYSV